LNLGWDVQPAHDSLKIHAISLLVKQRRKQALSARAVWLAGKLEAEQVGVAHRELKL
jgi:hypothetical protein